jgi:hypothetical protein
MEPTEFLISGYKVRHDGTYNWIIEKPVTRTNRKTGEAYLDAEIVGYYSTLQGAAQRLYREELKGKGQQNMKDMADLILQMEDKLEKAVVSALAGREPQ